MENEELGTRIQQETHFQDNTMPMSVLIILLFFFGLARTYIEHRRPQLRLQNVGWNWRNRFNLRRYLAPLCSFRWTVCNHCWSPGPSLEASLLLFALCIFICVRTLKGLNSFPDTRFFSPLLQSIYPLCVFVYFACVCTCQRWTTAAGAGAIQMKKKKKVEVKKEKGNNNNRR